MTQPETVTEFFAHALHVLRNREDVGFWEAIQGEDFGVVTDEATGLLVDRISPEELDGMTRNEQIGFLAALLEELV